jgi:uncharacterized membrane protein
VPADYRRSPGVLASHAELGNREMPNRMHNASALRLPAVVTGVGLGGFFDGIVLHQVLQWHHMLSNTNADRFGIANYDETTVAGLRVNMLWDGAFHVTTYILVLVGLVLLWRALRRHAPDRPPWRVLWGGLLAGWGIFNVVEGIVDHHVLAIHHVYNTGDSTTTLLLDLGFLALGLIFLIAGWMLLRTATPRWSAGVAGTHGSRAAGQID